MKFMLVVIITMGSPVIVEDCPSSCNWNKEWTDLKEYQVHLVDYIKRHTCGIASAGLPLFSI
jgi:hypothetical protein